MCMQTLVSLSSHMVRWQPIAVFKWPKSPYGLDEFQTSIRSFLTQINKTNGTTLWKWSHKQSGWSATHQVQQHISVPLREPD